MAMYEGRQRRNGALREQAHHLRDDISALQKDMSQLRSDFGELVSLQWRTIGDRVGGSAAYVGDQVKTRPLAALGVAAGVGLAAGLALSLLGSLGHRDLERRH